MKKNHGIAEVFARCKWIISLCSIFQMQRTKLSLLSPCACSRSAIIGTVEGKAKPIPEILLLLLRVDLSMKIFFNNFCQAIGIDSEKDLIKCLSYLKLEYI